MNNFNNLDDTDLKVLISMSYFLIRGLDFNISQISTYCNISRPTVYKKIQKFEEQFFTLDKTKRLLQNHKKLREVSQYEKISKLLESSYN